jgi:hypothetical protein
VRDMLDVGTGEAGHRPMIAERPYPAPGWLRWPP